jgi:hypothetical protein
MSGGSSPSRSKLSMKEIQLGGPLTGPVKGLKDYKELFETLTTTKRAIKVFCEVADL